MAELISKLPKDITDYILIYLIDSIGIDKKLKEDIQHLFRCTLLIQDICSNTHHALYDACRYMHIKNLHKKYNKKMVANFCENFDEDDFEDTHVEEPKFKQELMNINKYAKMTIGGQYMFDDRPNNYSTYLSNHFNDYRIGYYYYRRSMEHYRVLHNIICMMDMNDRANMITNIHYNLNYLNRYSLEEFNEYDEYYYRDEDNDEDYNDY